MIFHIPQFFQNRGLPFFNDLPIFNKGSEAVYMFFSLSGFLIIRQLFNEKITTGKINLKNFYVRRILRIFPLYYLVAVIGMLYYNVILPEMGFDFDRNYNFWEGAILLFTFFPNIFSTFNPGGILEILWSIGVEEQFYLLVAPLILIISSKYLRFFLISFSLFYITLYHSQFFDVISKYRMMFFYFSFAGWCSLIKFDENKNFKILTVLSFVIVTLYFMTDIFQKVMDDFVYQLFSVVLFGFFLVFFTKRPISFFSSKKLIGLGKISYGIYMYHSISLQLVGFIFLKLLPENSLNNYLVIISGFLLTILITILAAHFSYKYFEKSFINLKKKFR